MALPERENGPEQEGPVIRDRRRIDPETGELREPATEDTAASDTEPTGVGTPEEKELAAALQAAAERTADLQRLQAEYANYRKRVERDRVAVRTQALAQVLGELLPVLDDIGRAREHGELTGGFKSVGESLEAITAKLGLTRFAEKGEEFDPTVHEALTMVPAPDVSVPTVVEVFQPGYKVGDRILRPARVVVSGPTEEPEGPVGEPPATTVTAEVTDTAGTTEATEATPAEEPGGADDAEPADGDLLADHPFNEHNNGAERG